MILQISAIAHNWHTVVVGVIVVLAIGHIIADIFEVFKHNGKSKISKYIKERQHTLVLAICAGASVLTIGIEYIVSDIAKRTEHIEALTVKLNDKVDVVTELRKVRSDFDPILDSVFNGQMDELILFFARAIHQKRFTITDPDKFAFAYAKTLTLFPKTTIVATSLLDSSYFWSATDEPMKPLERKLQDFIRNGGKNIRIFYADENDMKKERTKRVLERQAEIGIETYTINKADYPKQECFVYYEGQDFGWIVNVDPSTKKIQDRTFTRNTEDIAHYTDLFNNMKMNATCVRCQNPNK